MKSFREYLKENETIASAEDYKTTIFDDLAKSNGFSFKNDEEENKAREAFAASQTNANLSTKDKEEAKQDIINTYSTSNIKATKSDKKKLDFIKANYDIAEKVLEELVDIASYNTKENFKTFKKASKTDAQAEVTSFADNIVKNRYDNKSADLVAKCIKAIIVGAAVKNFDKEEEYQSIIDNITTDSAERNIAERKIRALKKHYEDFGNMIGYGNFGGRENALSTLIGAEDSEIMKYAKIAASETPKNVSGKFTKLDSRGRPISTQEQSQEDSGNASTSDSEEDNTTPATSATEQTTSSTSRYNSIRDELPLNINAYKNEVDKIVNAEIAKLKERFNIKESVSKKSEKIISEMIRATHDKDGNETEVYKKYKGLAASKFINKEIEKARKDAMDKLDKYFEELNNKITTTNKKADLRIKIKHVIPELEKKLINSSYGMSKKLTQNEVGITMDAAKNDIKNVATGIKKAVTQNAVTKNVVDKVTTMQKQAEADKPAKDAIKAEKKAVSEKNTAEAKSAAEEGGDGGIVGVADQIKKQVANKLRDVWYGRKAKATQAQTQAAQPQQAYAPPPPVNTPPVINMGSPTPQMALPAPANSAKSTEDIKRMARERFTPKPADIETPAEKAAREAKENEEKNGKEKLASIDTEKLKKIKKAMKGKIK